MTLAEGMIRTPQGKGESEPLCTGRRVGKWFLVDRGKERRWRPIAKTSFWCSRMSLVRSSSPTVRSWLASRRGQSRLFGIAGVLVAAFAMFARDHWLPMGLAAAAPWVALAINRASHGRFGFEPLTPGKSAVLTYWALASVPVIALFVIGSRLYSPISLIPLVLASIILGGIAGVVFFSLVFWPPKRKPDVMLKALGGVGFVGYAYGCLAIANGMLPQPPPAQFEVRIVSKYVATGRNQPKMFVLEPWGPFRSGAVQVSLVMYDQLEPGQSVCMLLHPGGLELPWWEIAPWTAKQADPECPRAANANGTPVIFVAPPT